MEKGKYKLEHTATLGKVQIDIKGNLSIMGEIQFKLVEDTLKPLKRLVGYACYDGKGYSRDEEDIVKKEKK